MLVQTKIQKAHFCLLKQFFLIDNLRVALGNIAATLAQSLKLYLLSQIKYAEHVSNVCVVVCPSIHFLNPVCGYVSLSRGQILLYIARIKYTEIHFFAWAQQYKILKHKFQKETRREKERHTQ